MGGFDLRCGDLLVRFDPKTERLSFERAGHRLPWELDLGAMSSVTTRKKSPGAADVSTPLKLADLTLRRLSPNHGQWLGEVAGAGVALDVELASDGLIFTASPVGTGEAQVVSVAWPGELRMKGARREICWSDYAQGALFRPDGKPFKTTLTWDHTAMRVFGFTCEGESLAVIVDTPYDAEAVITDDGAAEVRSRLEFKPSMGRLSYPRRVRLLALEEPGYVAIANAFRGYAQANGLWKSFEERVAENPNVEKLRGAFVACAGYFFDDGADQVGAMKKMKQLGFERGYLFSPKLLVFTSSWLTLGVESNRLTDAQLREIQSLGYLCSPFLQVEEASPDLGEEKFAVDAKGEKVRRWQIGEEKYYEIAKWRIPSMLPSFDDRLQECSAIHFDTLTAMRLVENHGERPYDLAGDVRLRMEVADYYRRRGKLICSESMRDWGNLRQDLATSKAFTPVTGADPRVWTVPLTDLVYHDATVRTHWEHHSYDDARCVHTLAMRRFHPFGMELNDLLTASPPVLFPEGMLYEFGHREVTLPDGRQELEIVWTDAKPYRKRLTDPETQAALPKALRTCKVNRRHGAARMTSHRFLDERSPFVQESEFAGGLHVVVNFGDEPFTLSDGRTVPARGSVVEE